jgi:hypothetical protein
MTLLHPVIGGIIAGVIGGTVGAIAKVGIRAIFDAINKKR